MKGYITSVAAAAIMAAFADNLVPSKWQKYAELLTGAILLLTLIAPLLSLRSIEPPSFSVNIENVSEYDLSHEVQTELTKRVERDIEARLREEFGVKASARVGLTVCDDKIAGVEEISLTGKENSAIALRLKEVYGCENIYWRKR